MGLSLFCTTTMTSTDIITACYTYHSYTIDKNGVCLINHNIPVVDRDDYCWEGWSWVGWVGEEDVGLDRKGGGKYRAWVVASR